MCRDSRHEHRLKGLNLFRQSALPQNPCPVKGSYWIGSILRNSLLGGALFLHSLKFQISSALVLILVLFTGAITFTFFTISQHSTDHVILNLAGRLQLTAQQLSAQGQNYLENVPRDYPTYYRDVRLYYQDLMGHVHTFDEIILAFMQGVLPPSLTGLPETIRLSLNVTSWDAANKLEATWKEYRQELMDALGEDVSKPRLEWAAEHVVKNAQSLHQATDRLFIELKALVGAYLQQTTMINRLVLILALAVAGAILLWFYLWVLKPLGRAVYGFRRVAQGDFGHQVPVDTNNEIGWLTESFNELSRRLHAIFQLIDRVQQGSDLDDTLRFVLEEFSTFLPIEWVGSLFLDSEGGQLRLERAYSNGHAELGAPQRFPLPEILKDLMHSGTPLRIQDLEASSAADEQQGLLRFLRHKGMASAIVLPFSGHGMAPGALVFATRQATAYTSEHLELLTNIAHLVTHSFARTVKLIEQARLAAIGEFASQITHEIRNPLATIGLALEYFHKIELPAPARKRTDLAERELHRMERLLQDILLYAKPMVLGLVPIDIASLLKDFMASHGTLAEERKQSFVLEVSSQPTQVMADPDRLTQVFLNLARNACEAAPFGDTVRWIVGRDASNTSVNVTICNAGPAIPPDLLPRLTDPFVTTKGQGTGLGLSIVKRILRAHGGDLHIESEESRGTCVTVTIPSIA